MTTTNGDGDSPKHQVLLSFFSLSLSLFSKARSLRAIRSESVFHNVMLLLQNRHLVSSTTKKVFWVHTGVERFYGVATFILSWKCVWHLYRPPFSWLQGVHLVSGCSLPFHSSEVWWRTLSPCCGWGNRPTAQRRLWNWQRVNSWPSCSHGTARLKPPRCF